MGNIGLKDGLVQQIDSPLNLYNSPKNKFVAGFIGSPPMNFLNGKIIRNKGIWFDEENVRLKIPSRFENKLEKYIDKDVILGIRPENIHELEFSHGVKEKSKVTLVVEVVEPMGNEVYLYATIGLYSIIARLNAQFRAMVGQRIELVFNMEKCHFFDIDTQESIHIE